MCIDTTEHYFVIYIVSPLRWGLYNIPKGTITIFASIALKKYSYIHFSTHVKH